MARKLMAGAAVVFALALLLFPQAGGDAARAGLELCGEVILPALFPYFVLSDLAIRLGLGQRLAELLDPVMEPVFHVSGAGSAALALGLLGGYPVGAGTARTLLEEGLFSREEAQRLLCFCNNSGPAFILAVAGSTVFGSVTTGIFLLTVHILAALTVGMVLRGEALPSPGSRRRRETSPTPAAALLPQAVKQALNSSLQVSAYVVLFNIVIGLLQALPWPSAVSGSLLSPLLSGVLELSNGVCSLGPWAQSPLGLAVCAFLLGWGGFSVHCQTAALLEGSGLRLGPYLGAKLLQGAISAGLALAGAWLIPGLLPTAMAGQQTDLLSLLPLSAGTGAVLWLGVGVLLTKKGGKNRYGRV
ncbi:MAG: sporulation protein [Clostridiales bacterium]|nr:sporulation protein [Clostridiales bacterium]